MCKGTGRRPPPVSANTRWPLLRWAAAMWSKSSGPRDRKSTRLNSSHLVISYAVFCLKKKKEAVRVLRHAFSPNSTGGWAHPLDFFQKLGLLSAGKIWFCWDKFFFFNDTATTEIYTLSLHDALPI